MHLVDTRDDLDEPLADKYEGMPVVVDEGNGDDDGDDDDGYDDDDIGDVGGNDEGYDDEHDGYYDEGYYDEGNDEGYDIDDADDEFSDDTGGGGGGGGGFGSGTGSQPTTPPPTFVRKRSLEAAVASGDDTAAKYIGCLIGADKQDDCEGIERVIREERMNLEWDKIEQKRKAAKSTGAKRRAAMMTLELMREEERMADTFILCTRGSIYEGRAPMYFIPRASSPHMGIINTFKNQGGWRARKLQTRSTTNGYNVNLLLIWLPGSLQMQRHPWLPASKPK